MFQEAVKEDEYRIPAYERLAQLWNEAGLSQKAEEAIGAALSEKPKTAEDYISQGRLLYDRNECKKALGK